MKAMEIKKTVLQAIESEFREADIATQYLRAEDTGFDADLLTVLMTDMGADFDEVMLEMTFIPMEDAGQKESSLLYFVCGIIFAEGISEAEMKNVREAIGRINFYIPTAGFYCEEGTLGLKQVTVVPKDIPVEQILEACSAVVANGLNFTNLYVRPLTRLSEGMMSVEEALEGLLA